MMKYIVVLLLAVFLAASAQNTATDCVPRTKLVCKNTDRCFREDKICVQRKNEKICVQQGEETYYEDVKVCTEFEAFDRFKAATDCLKCKTQGTEKVAKKRTVCKKEEYVCAKEETYCAEKKTWQECTYEEMTTLPSKPATILTPLFRYYQPSGSDHFYTTNEEEIGVGLQVQKSGNHGYVYEGIQGYCSPTQIAGTVPLHRYYLASTQDHFYTTSEAEIGVGLKAGATGQHGYVYEGIQCYIFNAAGAGRAALLRYYNGQTGDHFYTTSDAEIGVGLKTGQTGNHGYVYEGIQGYLGTTRTFV